MINLECRRSQRKVGTKFNLTDQRVLVLHKWKSIISCIFRISNVFRAFNICVYKTYYKICVQRHAIPFLRVKFVYLFSTATSLGSVQRPSPLLLHKNIRFLDKGGSNAAGSSRLSASSSSSSDSDTSSSSSSDTSDSESGS